MDGSRIIGIAGLGLIGGSLAMAIKRNFPDNPVVGYDTDGETCDHALQHSLIDSIEYTFDKLVKSVNILFLTSPISSILNQINTLHSYSNTLIVSDVGSVKLPVMNAIRNLPGNITCIGGHPMTGKERAGIRSADPELFRNTVYVLCTPVAVPVPAELREIIEKIGAQIHLLDAEQHDRIASIISHLPQLSAVAMLNELANQNTESDDALRMAAGGFRDMTRIGSSPFSMWGDILATNKSNIIADLTRLIVRLNRYKEMLQREDMEGLEKEFDAARTSRERISDA
jgi:prephenate dehydrogenase